CFFGGLTAYGGLGFVFLYCDGDHWDLHSFPTRRSSDLGVLTCEEGAFSFRVVVFFGDEDFALGDFGFFIEGVLSSLFSSVVDFRSEEHTSELQSPYEIVCRLLLEKKKPLKILIVTPCRP